MSLRLAFDLDGTVADLHGALELETARLFPGLEPRQLDLPNSAPTEGLDSTEVGATQPEPNEDGPTGSTRPRLSSAQQDMLWMHVLQIPDFWMTLDELVPGAIARLATLAFERRWEILFVTTRPQTAGDTVQRQSQRWLESRGFMMPSVVVVRGSRGKVASALKLDAVVDDRPENCVDVVSESTASAVLIWPGGTAAADSFGRRVLELGITPLSTVGECLDILEHLDPSDPRTQLRERLGGRAGGPPNGSPGRADFSVNSLDG